MGTYKWVSRRLKSESRPAEEMEKSTFGPTSLTKPTIHSRPHTTELMPPTRRKSSTNLTLLMMTASALKSCQTKQLQQACGLTSTTASTARLLTSSSAAMVRLVFSKKKKPSERATHSLPDKFQ